MLYSTTPTPSHGTHHAKSGPETYPTPPFAQAVLAPGALRTLFQPIVRFGPQGWVVQALECLTRGPSGTHFEDATSLFSSARVLGLSALLDRSCVTMALETVNQNQIPFSLFVNVDAETLVTDPEFPAFLATMAAECDVPWSSITLEITEHTRAACIDRLAAAVAELQDMGMRVALDDFGPGEADALTMEACHPNVVKIEGPLLNAARNSRSARGLLERVVALAGRHGATIIAEGVERPSDMAVAALLGIDLLQGHLLCKPLAADVARSADACILCSA